MFDDGAHRFLEFLGEIPGGLQIDDVVIRKLFALHLMRIGHACAGTVRVHRRFLVRVLAVAQVQDFLEREADRLRKRCPLRLRFEAVRADALQS